MSKQFEIFQVDNGDLAYRVAKELNTTTGNLNIQKFSDGEITSQFSESIRDKAVFLFGSTDTQDNFFRLILSIDAAKRSSASEIIVVCPYLGYSRQDRRDGTRGPIGAKLMADMLTVAGATKMVCLDLHADQIQGFFDLPVDHIPGYHFFRNISKTMAFEEFDKNDWCICSPDAGGVKRADRFYKEFLKSEPNSTFAMLSKRRDKPNSIESMELIGSVKGKNVILVDDMVDTAGTLCKAADVLIENGAKSVSACITHGVLTGPAIERINKSKLFKLFITDSIPGRYEAVQNSGRVDVISNPQLYGNIIEALISSESLETALTSDL